MTLEDGNPFIITSGGSWHINGLGPLWQLPNRNALLADCLTPVKLEAASRGSHFAQNRRGTRRDRRGTTSGMSGAA
jgi:hypothetical protein